jgi:hypothetical protein
VEEEGQGQPHFGIILHEMRKAVESLAGRIDSSKSERKSGREDSGEQDRDYGEQHTRAQHESRRSDERGERGTDERSARHEAHAPRRVEKKEGLHVLSEELDDDVVSGERALRRGNIKLAQAKLAAATRLRQSASHLQCALLSFCLVTVMSCVY